MKSRVKVVIDKLENVPLPAYGYRKVEPKRPAVIRKGNIVKKCFYYKGMRECLGVRCYWPMVGQCKIYEKLYARTKAGRIAARKRKSK